MADFKLFEPILLGEEGGWCKKIGDSGGETWEGVAYNYCPKWSGWPIVFRIKGQIDFPESDWTTDQVHALNAALRADAPLQALVDKFYECSEWDTMLADEIQNQSIANFLVDWEVNAGEGAPVKHAQIILGVTADGGMGPHTLAAINGTDGQNLFIKLQAARKQFYMDVAAAHPQDRQFLEDWLRRNASFKYSA